MNEIDQTLTAILLGAERCLRPPPIIRGYDSIFPSDHRPLFLDFDARRFFDAKSFTAQPHQALLD